MALGETRVILGRGRRGTPSVRFGFSLKKVRKAEIIPGLIIGFEVRLGEVGIN